MTIYAYAAYQEIRLYAMTKYSIAIFIDKNYLHLYVVLRAFLLNNWIARYRYRVHKTYSRNVERNEPSKLDCM